MYTNFRLYLLLILCVLSYSAKAQQSLPDSLNKIAVTVSNDSAAKLYVQLARHFLSVSPDSVVVYANKALKIAPANSVAVGDANIQLGNYSHMSGNMDSAIYYYTKAQTHFKKINNEKGIGKVYQSFAVVKQSMKDFEGALNDNLQAIAIYEKIGFRKGLTMAYMGAGNNNKFLGKKKEGAIFFFKAMDNALSLGDSAFYYQTMAEYASLKYSMSEKDSAIYYFDKSIPYLERNNFRYNLISAYITYSEILIHEKPINDELVRKYTFGSLTISKELDVKDNLQYIYGQIGLYCLQEQT
jgi:tetratricopeptide (TPR) repeat protein